MKFCGCIAVVINSYGEAKVYFPTVGSQWCLEPVSPPGLNGKKQLWVLAAIRDLHHSLGLGWAFFTPVPNRTILTGALFPWIGKLHCLVWVVWFSSGFTMCGLHEAIRNHLLLPDFPVPLWGYWSWELTKSSSSVDWFRRLAR